MLLRLDPAVYEALARWAGDELRSANAQIEFLLRRALAEAGRLPGGAGPIPAGAARPAPGRHRAAARLPAPPRAGPRPPTEPAPVARDGGRTHVRTSVTEP